MQGGLSLYGVGFGKGYELFGELAVDHHTSVALLAGGTFEINPALLLNLSFRTYQPEYAGQTPKAYGAKPNRKMKQESSCGMNIAPFSNARLYLFTDISGESNVPGYGSDPAIPSAITCGSAMLLRMGPILRSGSQDAPGRKTV